MMIDESVSPDIQFRATGRGGESLRYFQVAYLIVAFPAKTCSTLTISYQAEAGYQAPQPAYHTYCPHDRLQLPPSLS